MKVQARRFTATFQSWESMLEEVSNFATKLGRENLITISCSEFGEHASTATIVVWYWGR